MARKTRFAEWLAVSMDNAGITKRELGVKIDMDPSNVTHWTKGRAVPSVPTLTKIAAVFHVDPVRLLVTARPGEFPPDVYGDPLPVPEQLAYKRRAHELLDELAELTGKIRAGADVDQSTLEAISTIRRMIKGDET